MVEKIIINPTKVRAYGNIVNVKSDEDYEPVDCTLTEDTDTVYGATVNVIVMEPDLGEATTLTVTSSSSTLVLDGTVTISATLKDSSNAAISGATITFKEGTTTLGTGTTNSSGVATYTYTGASVGDHTINAGFAGDSTYASSTGNVSVTVNKKSTSTALTSSGSSVTVGTSVTLTATVTSGGTGVNGLTVLFKDGTSTLGTGTTNSSGVATYTTDALTEGTHSITAVVTETSTYSTSTSTAVTVTVSSAPSYLFYDDCSSSSGLNNYGSLVSLESSGTNANMTYDSTENAYAITSLSSGMKCFPITDLNGEDNFKLTCDVRTPSNNNNYAIGIAPIIASTHTGMSMVIDKESAGFKTVVHRDKNNSEQSWGEAQNISNYNTANYYKMELVVQGDSATWNLYDGNLTLLRTYSYTLSDLSTDYNTLSNRDYGISLGWSNNSATKMYVKNIKAESL